MNSPRKFSPRFGRNRSGMSFVEFVGCLLALGSGVAIGSVYLGVDMKTLFVGILERAELVDPGFFGNKAIAQQIPPATQAIVEASVATAIAETATAVTVTTKPEPQNVAATVAAADEPAARVEPVESTEQAVETASTGPAVELTDAARLAATLTYWHGLTTCIAAEKEHRSTNSFDFETLQLFDYLTLRREGHQRAVDAIELLDENGVDDRLLWHGRQVLSWHQAGANLYGRAVDLLTDAPTDQLTGPFAQSWQSSATQHRMEEKLVREKHLSVAGYLDHTYRDQAPFKPAF